MSENSKVIKRASLVGSFTALSRLFGLVRDIVIAGYFGASRAADAFFVAFMIPNVLRRLFAEGALTISFIPVFKETQVNEGEERAKKLADVVFTFLLITVVSTVVASIIAAPFIVKLITYGFKDPDKFALTVFLTRIIFPYLAFISLVAFAMGVLNSLGRFAAPAAAPVLLNISIILAALFLSPMLDEPVVALAIGVVIGGLLQVLLQIPSLKKVGYLPRINCDFKDPAFRKIFILLGPALFGIAIYQLNVFISKTFFASFLPEGSVSYLYYADRFFQLPLGIFVVSMATAILPTMSDQAASKRIDDMRESISFSLRVITFITLPAAAGLYAVSTPVFSLFFQWGEFDYETTLKTAEALKYYALGLWAVGGTKIIVPAFYAMQDMKTPVWTAFIAFIANIILSLVLMGPLQHGGLALATTLSSLLNMALLAAIVKGRVGRVIDAKVVSSFIKALAGAVVTAFASYYVTTFGNWQVDGVTANKVVVLSASIATGIAVYMLSSLLLKSEEASYIVRALNKKFRNR